MGLEFSNNARGQAEASERSAPRRSARRRALIARLCALAALLFAFFALPALAVNPDEVMRDPALEARARALSAQLRCMVCQNQSIDDSDAPLARDIRLLIRDRIAKGESNDQVRAFLVSRYGDFILLKPPFQPDTLLLWLCAPLTLVIGAGAVVLARRRAPAATTPLSPQEEARLAALTGASEADPYA
jgi:cytochrome c-type biogenesis protein CcmH